MPVVQVIQGFLKSFGSWSLLDRVTIPISFDDLVLLLVQQAFDVLHRQRLIIVIVLLALILKLVLIELSQVRNSSRIVWIVQYGGIAVQLVLEQVERVRQHFPVVLESALFYHKLFFQEHLT